VTLPAAIGEKQATKDHRPERLSHLGDDPEPRILNRTLNQAAPFTAGTDPAGNAVACWAETLIATEIGNGLDEAATRELCARVRCPVLVIQGTADAITGPGRGIALAKAAGGELVLLEAVRCPRRQVCLARDNRPRPSQPPDRLGVMAGT